MFTRICQEEESQFHSFMNFGSRCQICNSICSRAVRHKEQRFNVKSARVTSMILIMAMAIISTLAPTLFYQTFGNIHIYILRVPDNLKY